ncbi:MAG: hypothetical protein AAB875_06705, partial [Patescibacteria group bacterium]
LRKKLGLAGDEDWQEDTKAPILETDIINLGNSCCYGRENGEWYKIKPTKSISKATQSYIPEKDIIDAGNSCCYSIGNNGWYKVRF